MLPEIHCLCLLSIMGYGSLPYNVLHIQLTTKNQSRDGMVKKSKCFFWKSVGQYGKTRTSRSNRTSGTRDTRAKGTHNYKQSYTIGMIVLYLYE